MTTRRLYNDLSDEAPSTAPVLAVLSVLVDCLEQSNLCVFVSPLCVFVCDRRQVNILNLCETPSIILSNTQALMAKWMKRLPT